MSYSSYTEYLQTPQFRAVVAAVRRRANGACEDCRKRPGVEAHHVKYCRWGAFDTEVNLVWVCRACHERRHTCSRCGRVAIKARHIKAGVQICDDCNLGRNHATD